MAKGITNQPLTIIVSFDYYKHPAIEALAAKGHKVMALPEDYNCDLFLGPQCHMLTDEMLKKPTILAAALKAARKRKKETKNGV